MTKNKKILSILMITILAVGILSAIGTGIYFGVSTVACEGYIVDKNSNAPIANVVVSDGKNVVKTDNDGYYKLKGWHKGEFITVTNPAGYWTEDYYIRINSKTKEYNFSLEKSNRDDTNYNFIHVSDSEVGAGGVGAWIEDIKKVVERDKPAFIMHTGDICYTDGLKSHILGMNTEIMGVPVRYSMGNHDYVEGKYGEAVFEDNYGPAFYSFDVGNVHYMVTPYGDWADYPGRYSNADIGRWVANDLKNIVAGQKVVMFNHDFADVENEFTMKYGGKTIDYREYGLIAWIFGHWHYNYVNSVNGILNISTGRPDSGGIDGTVNSVRSVVVEGGHIARTFLNYSYTPNADASNDYIWKTKLPGRTQFSEPIVQGDVAYVATISDDYPSTSAVTAINMLNGVILWETKTINSVRNSMDYAGGKIFAQDSEGNVYAIDATNGDIIWQKDTGLVNPRNTGKNVLVDGDKIYCGNAEKITCLNILNGSEIWQVKRTGDSSSPTRFVIEGKYLLVGSHWDDLYAYDKTTGKKLWDSPENNIYVASTPLINGDKVILAYNDKLLEMELSSGKKVRETTFKGYSFDTASAPLLVNGIAYYGTANKGVVAIELSTMTVKWNFETRKNLIYTSPYTSGEAKTVDGSIVERDGKLYFGALDGYVYCIDKNSGEKIADYNIGEPIMSAVAFYGDQILVTDFGGNVTLINNFPIKK